MTDQPGERPYAPTHDVRQISFRDYPMRIGTKLQRTMYLRTGRGKVSDVFVGVADTPELAAEIMKAVNVYYGHEES
jgi:hypothetical protein